MAGLKPRKATRESRTSPTAPVTVGPDRIREKHQHLTLAERWRIIELHRANPSWTYQELADATGVHMQTAREICIFASKSAAEMMAAGVLPFVEDWVVASREAAKRGDHRPAKDWMLHAQVIDPIPDVMRGNPSGPPVVIINQSLPGLPGSQAILVDGVRHELHSGHPAIEIAPVPGTPEASGTGVEYDAGGRQADSGVQAEPQDGRVQAEPQDGRVQAQPLNDLPADGGMDPQDKRSD